MGLVRVDRGQLVLVAAAVIAIGLAPVLFAYLQLGYHPDVEPRPDVSGGQAVDYLDRSVHDAAAETAGEYAWRDRDAMAAAVRDRIDADVETLERARLEEGVTYVVGYNDTAAERWLDDNCVSGDGKRFGDCAADDGVVLQDRAGEAVLLAVAFDVRVVGPDGESELTVVVEVGGG
jgi:hypothetical protein